MQTANDPVRIQGEDVLPIKERSIPPDYDREVEPLKPEEWTEKEPEVGELISSVFELRTYDDPTPN